MRVRTVLDRRAFVAAFATLGTAAGWARPLGLAAGTPGLAVTIDDFDLSDTFLMTAEDRDAAIRDALKRHHVKAAGFVAGKYVNTTLSPGVLSRWSADGHIGNHSFAHEYFNGGDPARLMADILRCEPLLSRYSGFRKLFRFPYLAEGKTAAGRDAMRALLKQHDRDLSWKAEDSVIRRVAQATADLPIEIEVENQAGVHLWYENRFGGSYPQPPSVRAGIGMYLVSCTCVGIDVTSHEVYAPYGLDDLAAGLLAINPSNPKPDQFRGKAESYQCRWPWLRIVHDRFGAGSGLSPIRLATDKADDRCVHAGTGLPSGTTSR